MNDTTLLNDPNVIAFAERLLAVQLKRDWSLLDMLKRNLASRTKPEREAIIQVWTRLATEARSPERQAPSYFR